MRIEITIELDQNVVSSLAFEGFVTGQTLETVIVKTLEVKAIETISKAQKEMTTKSERAG